MSMAGCEKSSEWLVTWDFFIGRNFLKYFLSITCKSPSFFLVWVLLVDASSLFDHSSVVVECHKVKRSRDDYNGAGPSEEGSSNDIPNPKRIKKHTEADGNSDSEESSEYEDCEEE